MKITLYKDCVVRDTYSRVFSPTVFEDYLATLTKTDFDIDSSYAIMGGSFSFDWGIVNAASPYVYNYMKVDDDDNGIMFYAFVNRVDLANGCVVITYSNDIWHTFIGGCRMYDSLINQSKHTPTGKYHFLPIDYLTNEGLEWNYLEAEEEEYKLAFELQFYELVSSVEGEKFGKRTPTVCFSSTTYSSIADAQQALFAVLVRQGTEPYALNREIFTADPETESIWDVSVAYFDVINAFIIRKSWFDAITTIYPTAKSVLWQGGTEDPKDDFYLAEYGLQDFEDGGYSVTERMYIYIYGQQVPGGGYIWPDSQFLKLKTLTIPKDFKIISVGPITTPVPAQNNGTENPMSILCSISQANINFYLEIYGQRFDITELVKINVPFTAVNAETSQLRRLADQEKRDKAITKMITGSIAEVGNQIKNWTGVSEGTSGATMASKIGGSISSFANYYNAMASSHFDIRTASAYKYQTNYAQDVESSAFTNAFYGLGYFTLAAVDNQEEIDFAIDNYGYVMGVVPTTDLPYNPFNLESGYNPTSYSQVNLFGSCPQNILNQLEGILRKGTKIYYSLEEVNGTTN